MKLIVSVYLVLALQWLRIQLQRFRSLALAMTGILVKNFISHKTFSVVYLWADSQASSDSSELTRLDLHSISDWLPTDCRNMFAFEVCTYLCMHCIKCIHTVKHLCHVLARPGANLKIFLDCAYINEKGNTYWKQTALLEWTIWLD